MPWDKKALFAALCESVSHKILSILWVWEQPPQCVLSDHRQSSDWKIGGFEYKLDKFKTDLVLMNPFCFNDSIF